MSSFTDACLRRPTTQEEITLSHMSGHMQADLEVTARPGTPSATSSWSAWDSPGPAPTKMSREWSHGTVGATPQPVWRPDYTATEEELNQDSMDSFLMMWAERQRSAQEAFKAAMRE